MLNKPGQRRRLKVEDILAYLAVLLMAGWIFKILPTSATTGRVWGVLWRSLAVLGLVVVPMAVVTIMVIKYIRLSRKVS